MDREQSKRANPGHTDEPPLTKKSRLTDSDTEDLRCGTDQPSLCHGLQDPSYSMQEPLQEQPKSETLRELSRPLESLQGPSDGAQEPFQEQPDPPPHPRRNRARNSRVQEYINSIPEDNLEPQDITSIPGDDIELQHEDGSHHSGTDHEQEHSPPSTKPSRLTRRNLWLLTKMTKIRFDGDTESSTSSEPLITPSCSEFATRACDQGILNPKLSKAPSNIEDLRACLEKSRGSPEPSENYFETYCGKTDRAINKATLVYYFVGKMVRPLPDLRDGALEYDQILNQRCDEFPVNIGFNNALSAPKPDIVEGFYESSFGSFPIADELSARGGILYGWADSVVLPHFAGELTGPGGCVETAQSKSAHDGACFVYARNQALMYMADKAKDELPPNDPAKDAIPSNDKAKDIVPLTGTTKDIAPPTDKTQDTIPPTDANRAAIVTFTSNGKDLDLFGHFATESEQSGVEYHQCLIATESLVNTYDGFKRGRRMIRNAQEFARDEAQKLREGLVTLWREGPVACLAEDG